MLSRKTKHFLLKIVSMVSVVRGYNVLIIAIAQYLASIFILAPEKRALSILLDFDLFILVLASSLTIASGYIINNFYDSKKDLINRPIKSRLDRLVSQKTKLNTYFTLNFIVAVIAFFISIKAVLFFSTYIFIIWFYSHKVKKYPIIGNLTASILAVLPFFAILLYFKNFYPQIVAHAAFLFLLILIREIIKDLENLKGDIANNYLTIAVRYGVYFAKQTLSFLTLCTVIPIYFLVDVYNVGYMNTYFYISLLLLILFTYLLWKAETKADFLQLHNLLKLIIVSGVFCIVLIDPEVIFHGKRILGL